MKSRTIATLLTIPVVTALALTGCSAGASGDTSTGAGGTVSVVASTNVYGDIAKTIAGGAVDVTSLMDNPAQDPHSFEASAQNQLAVSKADIIIENGGGYDDFMDTLRKSAGDKGTVLNVVDISGKKATAGDDLNEHVWYDFPTIQKFTGKLVDALSTADPSQASVFTKNAAAFTADLTGLEQRTADLKQKYAGEGAAITEPVPLYLLDAIGLVNKTPEAFSSAIENGTDVSPSVLNEMLHLFSGNAVKVFAYNEQTSGPETEKVLAAAKSAGVPVVPVTETLPAGKDYISWMTSNVDAVAKALGE
ncbi:metal ABC transporter solute-binding protein, Zn/Mn family [Leifsonia sp. NPDC102414]|uniref:metal ABC transporter solute-binding protein, Zn/Mn family n=1 Tax=Leifsonia sp. NPDC102414 TaxID=3364124 RepID=UPI00382CACAD